MTKPELIEISKRRLTATTGNPLWQQAEIEIAASVGAALQLLATRVMRDEVKRVLLQQDYTLALGANGRGALTAATAAIAGDIIPEGFYFGRVVDIDGNVMWPLKSYQTFLSPQPTFKAYYGLFNGQVYTRASGVQVSGAQDVQSANGPLTITANFTPAVVDSVPPTITDDLIDEVVGLAMKGVEMAA